MANKVKPTQFPPKFIPPNRFWPRNFAEEDISAKFPTSILYQIIKGSQLITTPFCVNCKNTHLAIALHFAPESNLAFVKGTSFNVIMLASMASSSTSSSVQRSFKYDVFLSFRGEDTRNTFVGHLYHALQHKSIYTYKDDERIKKGGNISDELIKSIKDSRFHIIVFSKNYASSSWCLEELVQIIECQKTAEQTAYPVFYDVEPSEVRKQSGEFGQVFAKHEKEEAVGKWRKALEEAAGLAGWVKNTVDGNEAKFIQKIVEEISLELRSNNFSVDEKLIGMEARVMDVVSSLKIGLNDVRMIGIRGMGGAGKTTLARAVFDHISFQFEGSSFVENVRENSNPNSSGLKNLQNQVLKDVLKDQGIEISNVHDGKKMMKKMLSCRKVLVVLDDVDHINQLEALAGELNWFKEGSRIIITTREEQVLVAHRVNSILDVNLLSDHEAICLFSRYAFGKESPIEGYKELSGQVVGYAAGLPLTITVLGSFLCGKNELEWEDAIGRLKTIPLKDTLEKLELSYIGLEEDYKEIFLDVACILKGWGKEKAIIALESCGFHARNGLKVLEQKSLITVSGDDGEFLDMHDHLKELGKNIVRRLHPNEPNKHSRLWIDEEIEDILANNQGTEATKCIEFYAWELNPEIVMEGLGNMNNLRFLRFLRLHSWADLDFTCKFDEAIPNFPNALRYLSWKCYPFSFLRRTFQANNLVALDMRRSRIVQLWEGSEIKVLKKLRFLNLRYSMLKSFDLRSAPNLEKLNLEGCVDLVELHIPVECLKLKLLNLDGSKLRTLNLRRTPNLETLSLRGCHDLVELHIPVECLKLTSLDISSPKLRTLALGWTPNLKTLRVERCYNLVEVQILVECHLQLGSFMTPAFHVTKDDNFELPDFDIPVGCRLKLISVNLNPSKLISSDLKETSNLETLCFVGCFDHLVEIHTPAEFRLKITSLNLNFSKLRTLDLRGIPNIETLRLAECVDFVELHIPIECRLKLVSLDLGSSKLRSLDLAGAPNLEKVHLGECAHLVELHMSVKCPRLKSIDLGSSKLRTLDLQGDPNLEKVRLGECAHLVELHMPVKCPRLKSIDLGSSKLRTLDLRGAPNLETLSVRGCYDLVELHIHSECPKLESINIIGAKLRTFDLKLSPNLKIVNLTECDHLVEVNAHDGCLNKLDHVNISDCMRFKFLFNRKICQSLEVGSLSKLHLIVEPLDIWPTLHLGNNLAEFVFTCLYEEHGLSLIGNLEMLISLGFSHCTNFESFSESICGMRYLTKLTLEGSIPEAPKDLDKLQCLEELHLVSTKSTHLPDSIFMLKHLKCLKLHHCWLFEELPEDLNRLERLEELILSECIGLRDIPNSLCQMKHLERIHLPCCIGIERLPEELGRLECLKELNIEGTNIRRLPQSIFELKGLRIVGFKWLLESYGFTSMIQTSEDETFCYVEL
ncbi:hypothetical protein OSB04_015673 [Centaurea solstitialis]|uniref:TIR domain-containing protein n=1 Tax=Centaurea solstitialis TaxID=347529 RepID=A0AA38T7A6_9ASTR|nr:hypothetical protein OSB04_015673 [Centaurea solstitialis]